MKKTSRCLCCDDAGQVEDIDGDPRPCSRCQNEAFHKWADNRRPHQQTRKSA